MIIAVDFDGFLFKEGGWPYVGEPIPENIKLVQELQKENRLILWTCRTKEPLQRAIDACKEYGIEFVAINNDDPNLDWPHGNSRKIYSDKYLDDRAINPEQDRLIKMMFRYLDKWKVQLESGNTSMVINDIQYLKRAYKPKDNL